MNRITDFVDSFIPKNMPKKKALLLKAELTCHIIDKADYYKEIGYDDTESVNKAIEDFGTDETDKKFIFNEFEELYSEKSIFSIAAFVIIALMNYLCLPLDLWVTSADFNRDPDPAGAFMSFFMIFVVLSMIIFARIKKYRKTLISIGLINTLIAAVLLASFYPQMASYTVGYNLIYLIDVLTPISMGRVIVMALDGLFVMVIWFAVLLLPALYCFVEAVRIKKGLAKVIANPKRIFTVFSAVFLAVTVVSCLLQPVSKKYVDDYPVWFDNYYNYISDVSQQRFDEIVIGNGYADISNCLKSEGYVTTEEYENTLDRLSRKQFRQNLKEFNFAEGYEIWFVPDKYTGGNGFVGLKHKDGVITAKAIGNLENSMYDGKGKNFGYSNAEFNHDMYAVFDYFKALKKGDSEAEVMSRFGSDLGFIYSRRYSVENSKATSYYRIYCYGEVNPAETLYYNKNDSRYIELTFEDGLLAKGTMYDKVNSDKGTDVTYEKIR